MKTKIAIYGAEKAGKFKINTVEIKPRIMEIGDISEFENLFTSLWREIKLSEKNSRSKHVENLIKFLFMEINIFLFLIISACAVWLKEKRYWGEEGLEWTFNIQLFPRGKKQ